MTDEPLEDYVVSAASFEVLYRREYPGLLAVARALTGDRSASEDLVQDTMVRTFINWRRVERLGRPGAWCLRVLTNACRGRWRHRQVERRWLERQRHCESTTAGPSEDVVAFWAAVRRLPERPRLVVSLFYAADRTVEEIASIVNVPIGTVTSDLSRSRTVLMRELERP